MVVARQHLVGSFAGKNYRNVLARELGDKVKRDAARIGQRLIQMPYQLRNEVAEVGRVEPEFMVLRAERERCLPSVLEFVVLVLPAVGAFVADAERLDAFSFVNFAHYGKNRARIQAAAEKDAERHLGN